MTIRVENAVRKYDNPSETCPSVEVVASTAGGTDITDIFLAVCISLFPNSVPDRNFQRLTDIS
jgi:hypothetical protein